ncbi:peroxisomal sarcosine oxidase-like [Babylonia areolata]|uniref:peroxisomal sarcosine oxidase-like n=1 Tax=Babylonia areolata TaxID=304850 RepID=UPI003FD417E5
MTTQVFDAIVIGAGIEGSSSAYTLAKHGQKTLLLEQFPLPHSRGSSHGQTRIIRYAYEQDFYSRMMLDAFPLWHTLAKEAAVQLFKQCGVLNLGHQNGKFLTAISSAMSHHGMEFEEISSSQLVQRYPMLQYSPRMAAVLDPRGGVLLADKALAAFQKVFRQLGGVLHDGEPVTAITPGQPLVTVTTTKHRYRAKKVVIAAGPWTGKLVKPLGVSLPFRPTRVTVMYWQETKEGSHASDRFPCLIDGGEEEGGHHIYSLPSDEYPGYVKVCLHIGPEIDPDNRDEVDDSWVRQKVSQYVCSHLPWLRTTPGVVEACIYTNTPDNNPVIDSHPKHKNIIIAAGFSGHGFKLAPVVGKAVSELVLEKPHTYTMSPFALSRFNASSSKL